MEAKRILRASTWFLSGLLGAACGLPSLYGYITVGAYYPAWVCIGAGVFWFFIGSCLPWTPWLLYWLVSKLRRPQHPTCESETINTDELPSRELEGQTPNDWDPTTNGTPPRTSNTRLALYSALILIASLTFLAVSCSLYYIDFAEGLADELGKSAGYAFLLGIVFFFLWRGTLRRKKAITFFWFALILCAVASYRSVRLLYDAHTVKNAARAMASLLDDAMAGRQITRATSSETAYGELTPLVHLLVDYATEVRNDSLAMQKELDNCNLLSLFDAKTLTQSDLLLQCQSNYEKAAGILQKYEATFRSRFINDYPTRIRNSALPENLRQRTLSSFNGTKDQHLKNMSDTFQVRKDFVSEAKNLLAFMSDRCGRYGYRDNKLVFASQEDRDTFETYKATLNSLLIQEQALVEKNQQQGLIKAKELQDLMR